MKELKRLLRNDTKNGNSKIAINKRYIRNYSERRKALIRDADDPNADLSDDARKFIKNHDVHKATGKGPHPTKNPISPVHEKPLYEIRQTPIDDNNLD